MNIKNEDIQTILNAMCEYKKIPTMFQATVRQYREILDDPNAFFDKSENQLLTFKLSGDRYELLEFGFSRTKPESHL